MKHKYRVVTNSNDPQINIRMPLELKQDLEERAYFYRVPRNSEILMMLSMVMEYKIKIHDGFLTVGKKSIPLEEIEAVND